MNEPTAITPPEKKFLSLVAFVREVYSEMYPPGHPSPKDHKPLDPFTERPDAGQFRVLIYNGPRATMYGVDHHRQTDASIFAAGIDTNPGEIVAVMDSEGYWVEYTGYSPPPPLD